MSLANSYRYEVIKRNSGLKSALKAQNERIKVDEQNAQWAQEAKEDSDVTFRSEWMESLAEVARAKSAKREDNNKRGEVRMFRKAAIMVRQAALKQLLEREYAMYEQELRGQDKAVYIQRT